MGSKLLYLVAFLAAALVIFAVVSQTGNGPAVGPDRPVSEPDPEAAPVAVPPPLADDSPDEAPPGPAGDAGLIVRVVSESGEPVAGATVTTSVSGVPAARREEQTDVEGTARFLGLPGGKRVNVQASAGLTNVPATTTANLSDGAPAEVRLVLIEGGAVSGTVFGAGGAPIATGFGIALEASRANLASGAVIRNMRGLRQAERTFPAGDGAFSMPGVLPGTYVVAATAEGHTRAVSEPFEVRKGAVTDGVRVFLDPGGRISGIVVRAATGEPIKGATVTASGESDFPGVRALSVGGLGGRFRMAGGHSDETDESGRFEIDGLEPGDYRVTASAKDLSEGTIDVVTVDKGRETGGQRIGLGDGGTLTGTVYGPDGRPVPGAEVIVSRVIANMKVFGNMGDRVKANDRGVYLVQHLTPGRYSVRRAQAGNTSAMAVSIVMSGNNAPADEEGPEDEDEVTIREGQVSRKDLLGDLACGITGIAQNEANEPIRTRIDLSLLKAAGEDESDPASRHRLEVPRFTNSNEKGEFEFTGLEPGTWKISAPGFSKEIGLSRGRTEEVIVRVRPSGIEGLVLDGDGKPMKGIRVRAESAGGRGMANMFAAMGSMQTDGEGRFSIKDLSPGKYRILANSTDREGRSEEIDLGSGEVRRNIRVVIETKVSVRVTVRDAAGEPVAGVWVFLQQDGRSGGSGSTDASGVATLLALPGSYRLTAMRRGLGAQPAAQPVEREVVIRPGGTESFEMRIP